MTLTEILTRLKLLRPPEVDAALRRREEAFREFKAEVVNGHDPTLRERAIHVPLPRRHGQA